MKTFKEALILLFCALILIGAVSLLDSGAQTVFHNRVTSAKKQPVVVIDAGHGGFDSGKVGIDGTLEKEVNLSIAKKLQKLLEAADVTVHMTRTTDCDLSSKNSSDQKRDDLRNRVILMNEAAPDCIVSIHQNSYSEESVDGAQVFYYTSSASGNILATLIQQRLVFDVDPSNHRIEKPNDTYYLLKNVSAPLTIVECGFLSNWAESKKLVDDTYQQKLAWAIHLGILQYLNGVTANSHTLR